MHVRGLLLLLLLVLVALSARVDAWDDLDDDAFLECPNQGDRHEPSGKIRSQPKGQDGFQEWMFCEWHIEPADSEGMCIKLEFLTMDVDIDDDRATVTGEGLQQVVTGNFFEWELPVIYSHSNYIDVVFESDTSFWSMENEGLEGMIAEWSLIACDSPEIPEYVEVPGDCPALGLRNATSGVLRSQPEDTETYRASAVCEWEISPGGADAEHDCLLIDVKEFDLEWSYDFLYLFSDKLGEYDEVMDVTVVPLVSSIPTRVRFTSDFAVQQGGFVLEYETVPCAEADDSEDAFFEGKCPEQGLRTEQHGEVRTQRKGQQFYSTFEWCNWSLRPADSDGKCIELEFTHFDLEWLDMVVISSQEYRLDFMGSDGQGYKYTTRSNWMDIEFHNFGFFPSTGFVGEFRVVECPIFPSIEDLVADCDLVLSLLSPKQAKDMKMEAGTQCCAKGEPFVFVHGKESVTITCSEDHGLRIHELEFVNVELTGSPVANMTSLPELSHVTLENTVFGHLVVGDTVRHLSVTGAISGNQLTKFPRLLQTLHINNAAGLTRIPPLPPLLTELRLSHTSLATPPDFAHLTHLTSLDVSYSAWHGRDIELPSSGELQAFRADFSSLGQLPLLNETQIVEVWCETCGLTSLPGELPETLEMLYVANNAIKVVPPFPQALRDVDLSNNLLRSVPPLPTGTELAWVDLSNNVLAALPSFERAEHLHTLRTRGNQITAPPELATSALVVELHLSDMGLTELPPLSPSLRRLYVGGNKLTRLPEPLPLLNELVLSGSHVTNDLHALLIPLVQTLERFECEDCGLSAFPFSTWPPAMHVLRLGHNHMAGELTVGAPVHVLDVRSNAFTALHNVHHVESQLVAPYNALSVLSGSHIVATEVDLTNNTLTSLPVFLDSDVIRVAHNALTSLVIAASRPPSYLDVANNKLHQLSAGLLASEELYAQNNELAVVSHSDRVWNPVVVNLANNHLANWHVLSKMLSDTDDKSLVSLDVSHNELTDEMGEPLFAHPLPQLEVLDISHNKFTGPLPALRVHKRLANVFISESGFGTAFSAECRENPFRAQCIGPELEVVSWRRHSSARYECAQLGFREEGEDTAKTGAAAHVSVDWAEFSDHTMCNCTFGHYGEQGKCETCPVNGVCKGRVVVAQRGHYWDGVCNDADKTHALSVRKCRNAREHVCAPSNVFASEPETSVLADAAHPKCADGYSGRLCGGCVDNYFQWGAECRECPHVAALAFLTMLVFTVMGGLVYVAYRLAPAASGLFKTLLFFVQLAQLMAASGVRMQRGMTDVLEAFRPFMFNVPLAECFLQFTSLEPFLDETVRALVLPFDLLFIVLAVAGVGLWAVSARGMLTEEKRRAWIDTNIRAFLLLLFIAYLRVASEVMDTMQCEFDACRNESFFVRAPHVSCDTPGAHMVNTWAWTMFFVYVLGIPALFLWIVWRNRASLHDETVQRRYDFLFASYSGGYWYWEGLVFVRKLCIVMVLTLPKWDSALVPFFVLLVLILSTLMQYAVQPYRRVIDNVFEFTSLSIQCMLWSLLLVLGTPDVAISTAISVIVSIAVMGVAAGLLVLVVAAQFKGSDMLQRVTEHMSSDWKRHVPERSRLLGSGDNL